jgi:SagB-type dehydrogenase family enzyme
MAEGSNMAASFVLSLPAGAVLDPGGDGRIAVRAPAAGVTLTHLSAAMQHVVRTLADGGASEDQLAEHVLQADGASGLSRFYSLLQKLGRRGWLLRTATESGRPLATLLPCSAGFVYPARVLEPDQSYVLSRFAYLRAEDGQVVLESPLAHAGIVLHDGRVAVLVHSLARASRARDVAERKPDVSLDAALLVMELLYNADMLGEADERGTAASDRATALQSWEFHDLLFHARSREGRHANPVGATYRFVGRLSPPAALKEMRATQSLTLDRPDLDQLQHCDPPFACVQENRKSIRAYAERPITARQLGEFLYRVGRVKDRTELDLETPHGPLRMAFATRPYPGGGALYELELYLAVNACDGIPPGLYHYDPLQHRLGRLSERTAEVERLLKGGAGPSGIAADKLQVLLIVAARFQRVAWKYASMAYALILKHVGVLYQTMYLAATAMNLAPCGIGCGDSDLFARAAGTDYYAETSVGEFLIGSKP